MSLAILQYVSILAPPLSPPSSLVVLIHKKQTVLCSQLLEMFFLFLTYPKFSPLPWSCRLLGSSGSVCSSASGFVITLGNLNSFLFGEPFTNVLFQADVIISVMFPTVLFRPYFLKRRDQLLVFPFQGASPIFLNF